MRVSLAIALVLPLALTGCPALLSDWSIAADSGVLDASVDATGPDGSSSGFGGGGTGRDGSSSGGSGGSSSGGSSSGGSSSSGGVSSSGGAAGSGGDADACTLVTHSSGLGQTWQDCTPLKTCDEVQALRACLSYCAANGGCKCATANNFCSGNVVHAPYDSVSGTELAWKEGATEYGEGEVLRVTIGAGYSSCAYAGEWE
jgi:hypothetical protein